MTGRPQREPSSFWNPVSSVCCGPRVPSRHAKKDTSGARGGLRFQEPWTPTRAPGPYPPASPGDTAKDSPTAGDWVAWVGTWDDIVAGRDGQYRVRLMDNTKGGDCAYPGVEVLPDGTILTTTYGHWIAGEEPFIVSVRLTLDELDARVRAAAEPPPDENEPLFSWHRLPDMPEAPGVGGGFCGVAGGSLVVAGGANFPQAPRESASSPLFRLGCRGSLTGPRISMGWTPRSMLARWFATTARPVWRWSRWTSSEFRRSWSRNHGR